MSKLKRFFAAAFIATFLAAIPLVVSVSCGELASVTYTIEMGDYNAKPPSTPGGGGKTPTLYKLTGYKWLTLPLTVKVNPGGLNAGFIESAITASAEAWDIPANAELVDTYEVSTSVTLDGATVDKVNEIVFGPIADSNVIAQCTFWYYRTTRELVDFEIVFNTYYNWGDAGANPALMDVQNIATHELGHGFGLADLYTDAQSEQTMYGYGSIGETEKRTLDSGDIAGIQVLYGVP